MSKLNFRRGVPKKLRYSRFADRLDVDAVEEAIGFDPIDQTEDEDRGHCFDFFGLHTHGDTTGKLSINREKRVWNCWVCGGGSLLDLAMQVNQQEPDEATEWLYQFVQGEESVDDEADKKKARKNVKCEEAPTLPYFNVHVLDRWGSKHSWFRKRGITPEVIEQYKLRYNPEAMKRPPKSVEEDPYVGPAIILPHFWEDRLVGWQHRWLKEDRPDWVKKYTNTNDFPRDETLFNYDRAQRTNFEVVVCESVPTVLFLESCGVPAVATFGDTVSEDQLRLLRRFSGGIIWAADHDRPGINARDKATNYLKRYIPVLHCPFVGDFGSKKDLGDLAPREDLLYDYLDRAYSPLDKTLEKMRR